MIKSYQSAAGEMGIFYVDFSVLCQQTKLQQTYSNGFKNHNICIRNSDPFLLRQKPVLVQTLGTTLYFQVLLLVFLLDSILLRCECVLRRYLQRFSVLKHLSHVYLSFPNFLPFSLVRCTRLQTIYLGFVSKFWF